MNLTRRIDLVGYLHIAYGSVLLVVGAFMFIAVTAGALLFPAIAAWVVGAGATMGAAGLTLAMGLPSIVAGIGLIRRYSWARYLTIALSVVDLFSFPIGTLLGIFSLWMLLKRNAMLEFR